MNILVVGYGKFEIYENAIANGFVKLEQKVDIFYWDKYFNESLWSKVEFKYLFGYWIIKLNYKFMQMIQKNSIDIVFVYKGNYIFPSTIKYIKTKSKAKIFSYNNDDPFTKDIPKYYWRHFIKGLQYYDWNFVYRE